MSIENPSFNQPANPEKYGRDVEILMKVMRHGERSGGKLLDLGREITRAKAADSGIAAEDFDAVKAYGSNAGAKHNEGVGRALETADIYAKAIAGQETFKSRPSEALNYETMKNGVPFDWDEIYNGLLPADFQDLPDEEKIRASKTAQTGAFNYLFGLKSPEAEAYRKESAGTVAYEIVHNQDKLKKFLSGSKVLEPHGTHGGMMEFILQQALVREDEQGRKIIGLKGIDEIGGEFDPSDSFNVDIAVDANGEFKPLTVTFDNPDRPQGQKMYLDADKVRDLAKEYLRLHQEV